MQIPVYSPQDAPQSLPNVQQSSIASPGLFSAEDHQNQQLGAQMDSAASKFADIAADIQHRQNADMIFRAETAAKTDYAKNYLPQALQRRGAAANGLVDDTTAYWDKVAQTHSKNLENEVQQHIFGEQIAKMREQSLQQMGLHEAQQRYVSLNESAEASIVASTNLAAQQVGTPFQDEVVSQAREDIMRRRDAQAQLNGWPKEVMQQKTQESLSNLHMQVIQNLVRTNPEAAQGYYDKVKLTGDWNGTHNDQAEKLIDSGNYLIGAQKAADKVMAMTDENGPLTEARAIEEVMAITKGKTQRAAVTEVAQMFSRQRQAQAEMQTAADNNGLKIWVATNNQSAIPPDVWTNMSGEGQLKIVNLATKAAKEEKVQTQWDVYAAQRKMARDQPDEFRDMVKNNIAVSLVDKLAPAQLKDLIDLQSKPKEPGEDTLNRQLHNAYDRMGWSEGNNRKEIGEFEWVARQAINDWATINKKQPDDDQRQKIIDSLARDRSLQRNYWFDKKEPGYKAYQSNDWQISKQTPDEEKDYVLARSALIKAGVTAPTDAQIKATMKGAYEGRKPVPVGTGTVLRDNTPESHADQVPGQVPAAPTTPEPVAVPAETKLEGLHIDQNAYTKKPPKIDISPVIQDRLRPQDEAIVKPYKGAAAGSGDDILNKAPAAPTNLPKAQVEQLRKEIKHYGRLSRDPKRSDYERDSALREMAKRALRLGVSMDDITTATRKPSSWFNF